jgi:hypothetical protein
MHPSCRRFCLSGKLQHLQHHLQQTLQSLLWEAGRPAPPARGQVEARRMPKTCVACGTSKGQRQFTPGQWKATNGAGECRTCHNATAAKEPGPYTHSTRTLHEASTESGHVVCATPAHGADHAHQVPRVRRLGRPTRRGHRPSTSGGPQHQEARKLYSSKATEKLTAAKKKAPVKKKEPVADKKKIKSAMKPPQKKPYTEANWLETELMATASEKAAAAGLAGAGWLGQP